MSDFIIHNMEQRSEEWHEIRVGKVGGSEMIGLSTPARMSTLIFNKLGELLSGIQKEVKPNNEMQRGIDLEPVAKEMYEENEMCSVNEVGYITNFFYKYLGLSPDGLVGTNGAVEIKCPGSAKHVKTIIEGTLPKDHESQIASYFIINEDLDWVDFVTYDDRVKSKPYFKIRVLRDDFEPQIRKYLDAYFKYHDKIEKYLKMFN